MSARAAYTQATTGFECLRPQPLSHPMNVIEGVEMNEVYSAWNRLRERNMQFRLEMSIEKELRWV